MSKKKQSQPAEDPKELNAAFLLKFAKLNYEAKTINVQMLNAFSNLLHYLSDSLTKEPQNYSQQIIKALIDIAITVEFNLHMTEDLLSAEIEPVLKFLESLFNFIDKVFTYQQKPNKDKAVEVIDLFWPLLKNDKQIEKVQVKHFDKIALVLQKIPNLPYIFEIEPHKLKINPELVLNEAVEISFLNEKINFSVIFRAALSKYNEKNKIFIESFLNFFEYSMNDTTNSKENRILFEKCLNFLMNISNSIGEKYNYIQIFFNRIIKSSNLIRNFVYALSSRLNNGSSESDMKIEKYYSNDHLLSLSFVILEKVITFRYITKEMSESLEIISRFSENWIDLDEHTLNTNDFSNKINSDFFLKIIKFLTMQNKGSTFQQQQISSLSKILENPSLIENQKGLLESQEMEEKRLYQFIRQCNKIRSQSQDGEDEMMESISNNKIHGSKKDDTNKQTLQVNVAKNFSKILQNLTKNKTIADKLKFKSIEKLEEVLGHCFEGEIQGRTQEPTVIKQVSEMLIKCLPVLISDQWMDQLLKKFLFGEQSSNTIKSEKALEIIRVLIIKKLEIQSFSKIKNDLNIEEFMNSTFGINTVDKDNVLNFHFLIFYIFLKKCSTLSEKEQIAQIQSITSAVISKLTELIENYSKLTEGKQAAIVQKFNKKLLILEFLLILILDHPSGSFKLSLKKIFSTDIFKVGRVLDLYELISINQKESTNNFFNLRLKQILSENKSQTSLTSKFLTFVEQLNRISFPKNYLHLNTETKEEKHLKIFLNIKINGIALSLNKSHKIPTLIQNINTMRKINTIDELEILLFSFGEYIDEIQERNNIIQEEGVQEQTKNQILEDSGIIVVFNYLLKINIESGKFNERNIDEMQNDVREQIKTLKVIHISVQQTLEKLKQLILNQNPPFNLKTLIKLLGSMKQSTNSAGIAQKYTDLINDGQIIKLISELAEDPQKLNLEFSQLALITMKKLLLKDQKIRERITQLQKVKLEQKDEKMALENEEVQILEEQKNLVVVTELSPKLKQLFLMYYPFKHELNLINLLKVRVQSAILQMFEDPKQTSNMQADQIQSLQKAIVDDLFKNITLLKQIIIKENQQLSSENKLALLWNFDYQAEQKFIGFIIKSILKMFSSNLASQMSFELNDKIFAISAELLDNEEICKLAEKQIGQDLNLQLVNMVSERVNQGCMIVQKSLEAISPRKSKKQILQTQNSENKETKDFLASSLKLYNVLKKVINFESVNSEQIINSLIQKDQFSSIQVTKFILQQLLNISSCFIKTKSDTITDIIFSYIMRVNESYTVGKQKLHIPEFICEFFDISHADKSNNWLNNLEKSDKTVGVCTPNPAYRCMKCDDKRLICYSCMLECHKGHPVLYLGDQKFPRCQCKQIAEDCCKLLKKSDEGKDPRNPPFGTNIFSYDRKQAVRASRHEFFMGGDEDRAYDNLGMYDEQEYNEMYRFGGGKIRKPRQFDSFERENIFALEPSYERMERLQNSFGGPQLLRQEKKVQENQNKFAEENFEFEDEVFETNNNSMEIQKPSGQENQSQIVSQAYYLPVFLQMFNEIHSGNEQVSTQKINYQLQKVGFDCLVSGKVMHQSWKATNAGSYNVRIRRENPLNNKSAAVSKQVIAQNQKFIVIASSNMLYVHSKQKYLQQLLQMKPNQTFQSVHQFNGNFDIHTVDFSPLDDFTFVAAGLHIIVLMQLTGDGLISRNNTQHLRISVNNDYINKVRASTLGIFYSTSYEIKLLNWSFKQMLTIKSSAECLLKEWCLYEKRGGCTIYCVTAHGYTEFIDVNPSDEGKRFFTHKVNDGRKSIETGANILVKDVQKIGKIYIGSFKDKDGTNMIANLVGDTTQNSSYLPLRNNYVDIFGKKYLIGQAEVVKGGENQMYVICTIREPITPEISIHQGQLVVYKIRKDRKCEFSLINTENKCEHFCVVPMGSDNWSLISIHDDGSLHFTVLNKPHKLSIDQECKRLREIQPVNNDQNKEKYSQIKESIKKLISAELLQTIELNPLNYFREFSDLLKSNVDVKIKKNGNDYEITLLNSTKLITGFTLPFVGNVHFPHRTVKKTVQVGLSNLEILHYFTEGTLKFKVQKLEQYKTGMDGMNQKFKQKLERLERLNEMAMDSERATQIINSIKQAEAMNDEIDFYGMTIDSFKNRISNFSGIFNEESTSQSKDKDIEKMGILLKIFIEHSVKEQNFLCEPYEILEFVKNLRKISLTITKPETYKIVKELIVATLKMYENMNEAQFHVFNDEFYPLKYATEEKMAVYYEMLKGEIGDNQVEEIINEFCGICEEDLSLGLFYLSKYPSLLAKIQKKAKKVDKVDTSVTKLLKLYVIGYQVLKYKNQNCQWILGALCSIFGTQAKNKQLRQSFYETLSKYANVKLDAWLKNVPEVDGEQNVSDVNIISKPPPAREENLAAQNNLSAIYSQFGMGEMDEEAQLRMAIEMSEMQFKQNQEDHFNFNPNQNGPNPIEEEKDNFEDEVLMMDEESNRQFIREEKKRTFLMDLVEHCTSKLNEPSDLAIPKIIVLYVVSKYINVTEDVNVFTEILERISRILGELNNNCDNFDKHVMIAYFSLFSNILTASTILKKKSSEDAEELCLVIKEYVMQRLESVKPEKVSKLKTPPNLLGRIFRGQKLFTFAHYAYGLASLLLPPCEPQPILLSLECYWLLPESKEHYTKMKNMTTIKQGIATGNIDKIYEVATKCPEIWRECNDVTWLESWIMEKKTNWEKALSLLALHYDVENKEESK